MKQLALASGLWVSIVLTVFGCETKKKGLGVGASGGAVASGGAIPTGGTAASGGTRGSGGATAAGGTTGSNITGTGGSTSRTGGSTSRTGGNLAGTGGNITGTGGNITGTGGNLAGTGGGTGRTGGDLATGGRASGGGATGTGGATTSGGTGGATASGGPTGTGGKSGGTTALGTSTGGTSGSGGATGTGLEPCTSSDGSGCSDATFCIDTRSDSCFPDSMSGCAGFCAGRRRAPVCAGSGRSTPCPDGFYCLPDPRTSLGTDPVSICVGSEASTCATTDDCPTGFQCVASQGERRCAPDRTVCEAAVTCKMMTPDRCPGGYARSTPDGCYGPCVPVELCACSTDAECTSAGASCDRTQGRCYVPLAPEPRCQLPFDVGPCDAVVAVFAFVGGECTSATYGGCGGNDNRFTTIEECLSRCQGMPGQRACPEGRAERVICLGCGAGGGCIQYAAVCAKSCASRTDCPSSGFFCSSGYCEADFCI